MLDTIFGTCLDLFFFRNLTSLTQRNVSYIDSVHVYRAQRGLPLPLPSCVWPDEDDLHMTAFDRIVGYVSCFFPKIRMETSRKLSPTSAIERFESLVRRQSTRATTLARVQLGPCDSESLALSRVRSAV
jgi:hypothetical protein